MKCLLLLLIIFILCSSCNTTKSVSDYNTRVTSTDQVLNYTKQQVLDLPYRYKEQYFDLLEEVFEEIENIKVQSWAEYEGYIIRRFQRDRTFVEWNESYEYARSYFISIGAHVRREGYPPYTLLYVIPSHLRVLRTLRDIKEEVYLHEQRTD